MAKKKAATEKPKKKKTAAAQVAEDAPQFDAPAGDAQSEPISGEELERDLEPHLDYGLKVLYRAAAIQALRSFSRQTMWVSSYAYQAVINDLRVNLNAIPDSEDPSITIRGEHPHRKIIDDYLAHFLQKIRDGGGGGGDPEDPNILQGP